MNSLDYRRQFIMGKNFSLDSWNEVDIINDLKVSIHPDLEYEKLETDKFTVILIGYLINPYYPKNGNIENLNMITKEVIGFDDLVRNTYEYGGRWVLIYNDDDGVKLINDPCGMRQVYYTEKDHTIWCASQPNILSDILKIGRSEDKDLNEYLNSKFYEDSERSWYGDGTAFKDIKHLLPNHYLNASNGVVKRYWLDNEVGKKKNELVNNTKEILTGSMIAITNRYSTMMGVTAGWDSRLLLAASKEVKNKIYYFVSMGSKLSKSHMDIRVPNKLLPKLGLNLNIIEESSPLRDDFMEKISKNVFHARNLPKTLSIQYKHDFFSDKVNINGNGNEITRSFYGSNHPNDITVKYLMEKTSLPKLSYLEKQMDNWLRGVRSVSDESGICIMDLFYWEQRMGNWGAMYPAEQDIAIEVFTPYNNRKLLMTLLNVDSKYRKSSSNKIHKKIIKELWEDTLSEPINPQRVTTLIKSNLIKVVPKKMKMKIKSYLK